MGLRIAVDWVLGIKFGMQLWWWSLHSVECAVFLENVHCSLESCLDFGNLFLDSMVAVPDCLGLLC